MIEVIQSDTFARWLSRLKALREGICEMRIDHGPGYRLYLMKQGAVLVILLAGGDKSTQAADIERAITIAREWRN
jgi:putative addiction module killer protein